MVKSLLHRGGHAVWHLICVVVVQCLRHIKTACIAQTTHSELAGRMVSMENIYICEVCQDGFMWKSDLSRHMKTAHINRRFDCTQCGKSFGLKKIWIAICWLIKMQNIHVNIAISYSTEEIIWNNTRLHVNSNALAVTTSSPWEVSWQNTWKHAHFPAVIFVERILSANPS